MAARVQVPQKVYTPNGASIRYSGSIPLAPPSFAGRNASLFGVSLFGKSFAVSGVLILQQVLHTCGHRFDSGIPRQVVDL